MAKGNLAQKGNIVEEALIDVSAENYTNEDGFFIRSNVGGVIKYIPINNLDTEVITKTIDASAIFNDPVVCRKVISAGTVATEIYVGMGT